MIFRPQLVAQIAAHKKTMTRRPVKPGDGPVEIDGEIAQVTRPRKDRQGQETTAVRYRLGGSYSVQPGRGRPGEHRITITAIRQERVGEITLKDAIREGFRTTDDFKAYWVRLYEPNWVEQQEAARPDSAIDIEAEVLARFDMRHASRPVWVLSFELDTTHAPRLLAARPAPDYVSTPARALPGEPEAVSEVEQRAITERAGMESAQWQAVGRAHRESERQLLAFEDRIDRARRAADRSGVSLDHELFVIRSKLRLGAPAEVIVRRLEVAERKAYRDAA